jgi:ribosomal protein S18 acetylase RimI-like enzyme
MASNPDIVIRAAREADLEAIVALLADDILGAGREKAGADLGTYRRAFEEISADPGSEVYVAEYSGRIVGCYQFTVIPNLSLKGARRAQIEGVRVADEMRGQGLGERLMQHAIELAREAGCGLVQLTSNNQREAALRFYERLGFEPSHTGFKMYL